MNSQREFFNSVAHKWDTMCVHDHDKINSILDMLNIKDDSCILDVACGTGILAPFLHKRNNHGKITCVDISENMIEVAKSKYNYENMEFIAADMMEYTPSEKIDAIILYSCFPHFENKECLITRLSSMLNKGGKVCICHSQSRDAINRLHESKAEVAEDRLPTAATTSKMMEEAGFTVIKLMDNEEMYVVIGILN